MMRTENRRLRRRSIGISLLLHLGALLFLQRQALWIAPVLPSEISSDMGKEKIDKDLVLRKSLHALQRGSAPVLFGRVEESQQLSAPSTHIPLATTPLASTPPLPFPFPQEPLQEEPLLVQFSLPQIPLAPLLVPHLLELPPTAPPTPTFFPRPIQKDLAFETPPPSSGLSLLLHPSFYPSSPAPIPLETVGNTSPALPKAPLSPLPQFPSLEQLHTISYSDAFDTELSLLEQEEGTYLFALTLVPKQQLDILPLQQCYWFLLDRSNSIQKERLHTTKNAVRRALRSLKSTDLFQIVAFDSKIQKLFPTPSAPTKGAIEQAEKFLGTISLGSFFSQGDPSSPLFLTTPLGDTPNICHTAILLSNGESLSKPSAAASLLVDWTSYNQGKVSLFALSLQADAHLDTLEALTFLNRGQLFTSPSFAGCKRKLLKLLKATASPVAKNLSCHLVSLDPNATVELLAPMPPHLYQKEPYTLLGKTSSLEDLVFFLQAEKEGEWIHIKKTLSFADAKQGSPLLSSHFALQKSYTLWNEYLKDPRPETLAKAKTLLEPFGLELPLR